MTRVRFVFARWEAATAAIAATSCGISVTEPISAGVGPSVDASDAAATASTDAADAHHLSEGLVAYWKLDETGTIEPILDATGNGHTGAAFNGPLPSSLHAPVKFGDSASRTFDGSSQVILIPNSPELDFTGEITLAAWVNVASITDGCHYVIGHGFCYDPPGEVVLRIGSNDCGPGGSPHNWNAGAWQGVEYSAVTPMSDLDLHTWIHIAGVYDGQAWLLYKNGEEVARQVSAVGALPLQSQWSIGAAACLPEPGAGRFWDGSIDDVRIYRRALSPTEMQELYHL
jgi:hypothetical protein